LSDVEDDVDVRAGDIGENCSQLQVCAARRKEPILGLPQNPDATERRQL